MSLSDVLKWATPRNPRVASFFAILLFFMLCIFVWLSSYFETHPIRFGIVCFVAAGLPWFMYGIFVLKDSVTKELDWQKVAEDGSSPDWNWNEVRGWLALTLVTLVCFLISRPDPPDDTSTVVEISPEAIASLATIADILNRGPFVSSDFNDDEKDENADPAVTRTPTPLATALPASQPPQRATSVKAVGGVSYGDDPTFLQLAMDPAPRSDLSYWVLREDVSRDNPTRTAVEVPRIIQGPGAVNLQEGFISIPVFLPIIDRIYAATFVECDEIGNDFIRRVLASDPDNETPITGIPSGCTFLVRQELGK